MADYAWWITAIATGFLGSGLWHYAAPRTDKLLATLSSSWQRYLEEKDRELRDRANRMRGNLQMQALAAIREVRDRVRSLFWYFLPAVAGGVACAAYLAYRMTCAYASALEKLEKPLENEASMLPIVPIGALALVAFWMAEWHRAKANEIGRALAILAREQEESEHEEFRPTAFDARTD